MNAVVSQYSGKRACVVGAGFGGLALAIRLQSAGVETVLVEARDKPGGEAYSWQREGFTFDAGPGAIIDPAGLKELWQLSGRDMAEDVELLEVTPLCRMSWPDGSSLELSNDADALRAAIIRIAPEDLAGYDEFIDYCAGVFEDAYLRFGPSTFDTLASAARALPVLGRYQAWRSLYSIVASHVRNEKLREALSFHTMLVGGNPMTASALYALVHKLEKDNGVWFARGGTGALVEAMVQHFQRLGGTLLLHDPVVRIHTIGNRASEVETRNGWHERFDAVASNADLIHTYRELLGECPRGPEMARKLVRRRFSPSAFVVHFALEGSWPGIPHHSVLFGPRFKGLFEDIHEHGVLPQDAIIYLQHPSVTDPSVAPEGKSVFSAMIPVANMGKLPVDWEAVGPMLERRVLDEIGRRLIPDIHDRVVTSFHYSPRDFALDLNAWQGSAYSLEPILSQSGYMRGHARDRRIGNLYFVGAGTHPGAGVPGVVAGAKAAARLILEDLK